MVEKAIYELPCSPRYQVSWMRRFQSHNLRGSSLVSPDSRSPNKVHKSIDRWSGPHRHGFCHGFVNVWLGMTTTVFAPSTWRFLADSFHRPAIHHDVILTFSFEYVAFPSWISIYPACTLRSCFLYLNIRTNMQNKLRLLLRGWYRYFKGRKLASDNLSPRRSLCQITQSVPKTIHVFVILIYMQHYPANQHVLALNWLSCHWQ